MEFMWIRHASFMIKADNHVIYIDPYFDPDVHKDLPKADAIIITHPTYDHGTQESVDLISARDTKVYATRKSTDDITGQIIAPGDHFFVGNCSVSIVRTYHSKEDSVGVILESEGQRLYYTSDTDFNELLFDHVCTVLVVPVALDELDTSEILQLCAGLKPRLVIPVHFGLNQGDKFDALKLKNDLEKQQATHVVVPEPLKPISI
ncbi:hypothetical protein GF342_01440 [Candidatus Woesearchaeota archaeon]|nr:hypothetical protein [Candidatus Woesearchaeota archaeon]